MEKKITSSPDRAPNEGRRGFLKFLAAGAMTAAATAACESAPKPMRPRSPDRLQDPRSSSQRVAERPIEHRGEEQSWEASLGETRVRFQYWQYGHGPLFVNVHASEGESVEAARADVERYEGSLLAIKNGDRRNLEFRFRGTAFRVDPNRIFTPDGARKTLNRLNRSFRHLPPIAQAELVAEVTRFSAKILQQFHVFEQSAVIALHNNTDGGGLSIRSFRDGGSEAGNVSDHYESHGHDRDDFFCVNQQDDFDHLKGLGYNVALYDKQRQEDDGSLIVACSNRNVRYLNVEAQPSHGNAQGNMIHSVCERLKRLNQRT